MNLLEWTVRFGPVQSGSVPVTQGKLALPLAPVVSLEITAPGVGQSTVPLLPPPPRGQGVAPQAQPPALLQWQLSLSLSVTGSA